MNTLSELQPLVSVVIPAYKARNYLSESLASTAAQDYPNLEVWVIDDESPEPIDDIIQAYMAVEAAPLLRVLRHETNQGLGASRNTGIRAANGEFVALLDHDDVWKSNHVSNLVHQLQQDNSDVAFCSVIQFENNPVSSLGLCGPPNNQLEKDFVFSLFKMSYITPSATVIRRATLLEVQGFSTDPRVHMCEDLDLWLRLIQYGAAFSFSKEPTAYYRKHTAAATSRQGYMNFQSAYVREMHFSHVTGPFFKKCTLVAQRWWDAFQVLPLNDPRGRHALVHALLWSLPVPWEIGRGLVRFLRHQRS